jgi:hypothetical protein
MRPDRLARSEAMASRQYGDQRLLDQEFESETGRLRVASKKRHVHLASHQRKGELG